MRDYHPLQLARGSEFTKSLGRVAAPQNVTFASTDFSPSLPSLERSSVIWRPTNLGGSLSGSTQNPVSMRALRTVLVRSARLCQRIPKNQGPSPHQSLPVGELHSSPLTPPLLVVIQRETNSERESETSMFQEPNATTKSPDENEQAGAHLVPIVFRCGRAGRVARVKPARPDATGRLSWV